MSLVSTTVSGAIAELKVPPPRSLGNVSIKNCQNATVGTKVDCHGNLIVNQYLSVGDSKAEIRNLQNGIKEFIVTDSAVKPDWKQKLLRFKYLWLSLFFALVITAISCTVFLAPSHSKAQIKDIVLPYNYTHRLRTRPEWFSPIQEVSCEDLKIHPAKFVIVAHTTTTNCYAPINCENVIKAIQNDHLKRGYCDIGYNFLIAGDGHIYEGVGWGKYGAHTFGFNCDSIGIAFLGNYKLQHLKSKMEEAFHLLIEEGLKLNEISPDYKLFGQNQVDGKESPGVNIIELLKKWKGWSELEKEDRLCK